MAPALLPVVAPSSTAEKSIEVWRRRPGLQLPPTAQPEHLTVSTTVLDGGLTGQALGRSVWKKNSVSHLPSLDFLTARIVGVHTFSRMAGRPPQMRPQISTSE